MIREGVLEPGCLVAGITKTSMTKTNPALRTGIVHYDLIVEDLLRCEMFPLLIALSNLAAFVHEHYRAFACL